MPSVRTGDIASSATDTFIPVDLRIYHRLAIQIMRQDEILQLLAYQFLQFGYSPLLHIILQTENQIIDDPIAILHDRRTYLYIAAAELDKLQRVAPGLNTAYTADIHMFLDTGLMEQRIARHLINHTQRNRFDRLARIAGYGLFLAHLGIMAHGDGFDGIDSADTRCTGVETSQRRGSHRHNIRCHLRDNRDLHRLFDIRGIEKNQFRVLSYIRAQTCQTHLRAGEIEFHGVASCVLRHLRQFYPFLLGLPHDRGYDDLGGIVLLEPTEDIKIHCIGIFAQLLHIAEADKRRTLFAHGVKPRRYFADILFADGFVEHTRPSGFQRAGHHFVVGADSRRSQKERVLAHDVAEIDLQ